MNQMAVFPPDAQAVPGFALVSPKRRGASQIRDAAHRATPVETRTAGMLVGRPDLSDEEVVAAIAERMTFEGRDATKAAAVLKAAFAGRPVAAAFLRRLVLPAPRSALAMPTQAILSEPAQGEAPRASWFRRMSFNR